MMKKVLLFAATLLSTTAADAEMFKFSYKGLDGTTGSGTISTSVIGIGSASVTGIAGTFAGQTITGLVPMTVKTGVSTTTYFTYDNYLMPGGQAKLDGFGIAFTAGTTQYNIFNAIADALAGGGIPPIGASYGLLTSTGAAEKFGTFTVAPVPEPATWGMVIMGVGAAGYSLRRRRQTVAGTTAAA